MLHFCTHNVSSEIFALEEKLTSISRGSNTRKYFEILRIIYNRLASVTAHEWLTSSSFCHYMDSVSLVRGMDHSGGRCTILWNSLNEQLLFPKNFE